MRHVEVAQEDELALQLRYALKGDKIVLHDVTEGSECALVKNEKARCTCKPITLTVGADA